MREVFSGASTVAGVAIVGMLTLANLPAHAQQDMNGELNAASYSAIPQRSTVLIRTPDTSPDAEELKFSFENALADRGFQVVEDSPQFILTFELSGTVRTPERDDPRTRQKFFNLDGGNGRADPGANSPSFEDDAEAEATLNVFRTSGGSVINFGEKFRKFGANRHVMVIQVQETARGRRAWQANIYADVRGSDPITVAEGLIPRAMERFGETVRRQRFALN